jgi:ABC-type uncharacterized transport system auxiliary subunit
MNRQAADITSYAFNVTRQDGSARQAEGVNVRIRRFEIFEAFQGRSFVYRTSQNTYKEDFYRQFFYDPANMITEAAVNWFSHSAYIANVEYKEMSMNADYEIKGLINALFVDAVDTANPKVRMTITFKGYDIRTLSARLCCEKQYSRELPLDKRSAEKIMAAWNEELTSILSEFDKDLHDLLQKTEG